jgi:hypothetical protein
LRSINFGKKYCGAKFLYKQKFGSQKDPSKRLFDRNLKINVLKQNSRTRKLKKQKVEDKLEHMKVKKERCRIFVQAKIWKPKSPSKRL